MSGGGFRLTVYDIGTQRREVTLDDAPARFVYAAGTRLTVHGGQGRGSQSRVELGHDGGHLCAGPIAIGGEGWVYELASAERLPIVASGIEPVLSHTLNPIFSGGMILRADRVASDPGARTPLHGHRGPGIRRLLKGTIRATIAETIERLEEGRAWFETGTDWVIGENISNGENVFVRVMLLPAELAGGVSSFVPATPEEAARPRNVNYRLFGEMTIA